MKVLVQSKPNSIEPFNINGVIALNGFLQRGYWHEFFSVDDIDTTEFRKEEPIIAGVGTYKRVFDKLGVRWERLSYPESLGDFMGRNIGYVKVGDLTALLESTPGNLFVKPANDDKRFTGFVCKHKDDRWNPKMAKMENTALLVWSDVVEFTSEFRVYVLNGHIQNVCRYRGIVDVFPNIRIVREMIKAFTDAPISYGLDVGVTSNGQTLLVEINEALALGNYGLPSMLHAKMIASRWFEVMGDSSRQYEESDSMDSPPYINQF